MKVKSDHDSKFPNLSNWKEEDWKNQGFNGIQTRDLRCDALSTKLGGHTLGARSFYWVHISREEWNDVKYIWNNSYLNCGPRRKWRVIIAVSFKIYATGKTKPKKPVLLIPNRTFLVCLGGILGELGRAMVRTLLEMLLCQGWGTDQAKTRWPKTKTNGQNILHFGA